MANNTRLHEYVGKIITALPAATLATDWAFDSDGANDIPIDQHKGVLFIADHSPVSGATADIAVWYASDGLSTNASVDSDKWASTDAVLSFDTDSAAGAYLLDVNISSKGLSGGSLFVKAEVVGAPQLCVIAIPYGGNVTLPSTNAQTVVTAD